MMKRTAFMILVMALMASSIFAQASFTEVPTIMPKDTIHTRTRITRDFYFNNKNSSSWTIENWGNVDIDIYPTMASSSPAKGGDSLTVEAYGLKRKRREDNVDSYGRGTIDAFALDSTRIVTYLVVDTTLHTYPLESYFDLFWMYDGVRLVIKNTGADVDSVTVWSNVKLSKRPIRTRRSEDFTFNGFDTVTVSTTFDTLALGGKYQKFSVMCDDATVAYYVSFSANPTYAVRIEAGLGFNIPVETDTITWKVDSGSAKLTVNKYKRRY